MDRLDDLLRCIKSVVLPADPDAWDEVRKPRQLPGKHESPEDITVVEDGAVEGGHLLSRGERRKRGYGKEKRKKEREKKPWSWP